MNTYTYLATFVNGNQEEIKASSKKAARAELKRLAGAQMAPKLKWLRKKY